VAIVKTISAAIFIKKYRQAKGSAVVGCSSMKKVNLHLQMSSLDTGLDVLVFLKVFLFLSDKGWDCL
jgi:hypothetical protein